jgi:uncharacterized protein (TIGR00269 family)
LRCDYCGAQAKVYVPHQGIRLCENCFKKNVVSRVKEEVYRFNMLDSSDTVLMGISGGKDSFVLLDVLSQLHDPSKLIALTIIEGIPGYNRQDELDFVKKATMERGVEHIVVSFKDAVGFSLSELVNLSNEKRLGISACTFCGIIRRRIINYYARQLGASKTATAHNLDDEAQTLLINIFRGDTSRLVRQHPLAPVPSKKLVKRIKPLRKIYEWEAATYAYYSGYRFQNVECPYIIYQPTVRARIRRWMIMMEKEEPGIMLRLLNSFDEVVSQRLLSRSGSTLLLNECKNCGEPTSPGREYCKTCELLMKIGVIKP